jgi:hypothetical protein
MLRDIFGTETVEPDVFALTYDVVSLDAQHAVLLVPGAELMERPARAHRRSRASAKEPDDDEAATTEAFADQTWLLEDSPSEAASVCSTEDEELEEGDSEDSASEAMDASKVEDVEEEPAAVAARARPGAFVVYTNGYFTFSNNPGYSDLKVRVLPVWCKPGLLGTSNMSKAVTPEDVGARKAEPARAMLVLRAWMLSKFRENDFCNGRACRRRLFAQELAEFRKDLLALAAGGPLTSGNVRADELIRGWVPIAFT